MKYFIDTEFSERPCTIELISIALVAEDGRELYLVSSEFDGANCNPWVQEHVLPNLHLDPCPCCGPIERALIHDAVLEFIGDDTPEFWGYYCVAPETKVLTADLRWVSAGDVCEGDTLMAFDEEAPMGRGRSRGWRRWRRASVEASLSIVRPCYDLTFEDGTEVRCSAEHRWLVNARYEGARWESVEDMRLGTPVVKPLDRWSTLLDRTSGYLAAAFDGEGHITQRRLTRGQYQFRLGFAQKSNAMLSEVQRGLRDVSVDVCAKVNRKTDVHQLIVGRREQVLRFLGSVRPVRLLSKFDPDRAGAMSLRSVRLVRKVYVGRREVTSITTDTGTYIAEGFASHNCDYDWVVFCWLFGPMVELPKGWPKFCRDLKQEAVRRHASLLHHNDTHNALNDARDIARNYHALYPPYVCSVQGEGCLGNGTETDGVLFVRKGNHAPTYYCAACRDGIRCPKCGMRGHGEPCYAAVDIRGSGRYA